MAAEKTVVVSSTDLVYKPTTEYLQVVAKLPCKVACICHTVTSYRKGIADIYHIIHVGLDIPLTSSTVTLKIHYARFPVTFP